MKKQMMKSLVAVVSVAALSLGIFPGGGIAEELGVVTESKAAEEYPVIGSELKNCQSETDIRNLIKKYDIPDLDVVDRLVIDEAFQKNVDTLEEGGTLTGEMQIEFGTVYVIGYKYNTDSEEYEFFVKNIIKGVSDNYEPLYYYNLSAGTIGFDGYHDKLTYKLFKVKSGSTTTVSSSSTPAVRSNHQHAYEWKILTDPTIDEDGVYAYVCSCGDIKEKQPISAAQVFVKDLYGKVKEAPQNGTVTYDAKSWSTISDYLLKKMAERNDVTVTIRFQHQKVDYEITFPAGTDYTAVLNDTETMYGFFGIARILGLEVKAL